MLLRQLHSTLTKYNEIRFCMWHLDHPSRFDEVLYVTFSSLTCCVGVKSSVILEKIICTHTKQYLELKVEPDPNY